MGSADIAVGEGIDREGYYNQAEQWKIWTVLMKIC